MKAEWFRAIRKVAQLRRQGSGWFLVLVFFSVGLLGLQLVSGQQAAPPPQAKPPAAQAQTQGFQLPFAPAAPARVRPRTIVTTDGEIDDRCSMIRFLLYANEFDVEGLIYSSSRFHWLGNDWSGTEWINAYIDMYERVYSNLRKHADGYPTPDELRRRVYVGNISNVGEMEQDSPGADRIVKVLLDEDPRPVYLQAWGGTNTIAKALRTIQTRYPAAVDRVSRKAIVFIILDQDETFRKYIEPNWPKLQVLLSARQFGAIAYGWASAIPLPHRVFFERPWMEGYITVDRGPLLGAYETLNGAFRSEGDSPAFMHLIDVGLRNLEHPGYGGWGGRFQPEKPGMTNVWRDAEDDGSLTKPIWRWATAFQNDWAARAAWCVTDYREANHPPIVVSAGPLDVTAERGQLIKLDVSRSGDPDGDRLFYSWWQYRDAGTYKGEVEIRDADKPVAWLRVPQDAKSGDTIHVIAEVTDSGKPPLTRYARVIVAVK